MLHDPAFRVAGTILGIAVVALPLACSAQPTQGDDAVTAYRAKRAEAAHRTRRIIFNNDGDDHLLSGDTSIDAFFEKRTTPLDGSQVDTIVYCTSRPFGMFLHETKIGEVLTDRDAFGPGRVNIVPDLLAQGTDPLRLMIDHCRRKGREIIWSMRMNDTHDTPHTPANPHYYFSQFKKDHPEYLFGTPSNPPKFGSWTAVDFAEPEVRDFLFRIFEEICQNFDVDGLEMDFFRHLVLFRTVANGSPASAEEREMMTEWVRRVRAMTEVEGMRRGKPILLTARVPDSVGYCMGMGLDIEQWMTEGLIDFLVAGGDFQLNRWEYSTDLGKRYNIPVYADLDPSVRYDLGRRFDRNSVEAYRGRAMEAWHAGAAGTYLFNLFNPRHPVWWAIGDPEEMQGKDKYYFVNVTGRSGYLRSCRALPGGDGFDNLPKLHPVTPARLAPGATLEADLPVAEDFAAAKAAGLNPTVTCNVFATIDDIPALRLNGTPVSGSRDEGGWFTYPVDPGILKLGLNQVRLSRELQPESAATWDVDWTCDVQAPMPWSRGGLPAGTEAKMRDGALLIADRSSERGSYLYYSYPWNVDPAIKATVEVRAKALSGHSGIIIANGVAEDELHIYPDRIGLLRAGLSHAMAAASDLHDYRVEIEGSDIRVFVDGELVIDGPGKLTAAAANGRNSISFGASTSGTMGEALWERVRFRTGTTSVHDVVLVVDYP